MATIHREPKQVKWIGVRPGHNGAQVVADDSCAALLTSVYLVPADSLFLWYGFIVNSAFGAGGNAELYTYNAVPALLNTYVSQGGVANMGIALTKSFDPPIELPAGYTIRINTTVGTISIHALIHGILIDA